MSTLQTNVPPVTITETGISVPQTQDILSGTLQDINAAFGGNLNVTSVSTPQYVLSAERAQAIALAYASLAFTLSQFDPDTAIGRFQDALARIYFIIRKSGTPTIVSATCTGIPGNTLPAGSLQEIHPAISMNRCPRFHSAQTVKRRCNLPIRSAAPFLAQPVRWCTFRLQSQDGTQSRMKVPA